MAASKINGQSRLRIRVQVSRPTSYVLADGEDSSISGLVVEYIVAIDVTRVRFPADAPFCYNSPAPLKRRSTILQTSFLIRRDFAGRRAGMQTKTTARGFEPLRAEPNGFRVHLLNRSDTLSHGSFLHRVNLASIDANDNKLRRRELNPGLPRDRRKY